MTKPNTPAPSTDSPPDSVVGSFVTSEGPRPFVFFPHEGRLELEFASRLRDVRTQPSEHEGRKIEAELRKAVALPIREIRFGEYHCRDCDKWEPARPSRWSAGICLSCSLDRGSELADRYFRRR